MADTDDYISHAPSGISPSAGAQKIGSGYARLATSSSN